MRELREVLQGSFEAHVGALGSTPEAWDGLVGRVVRETRHRRAWRAGAASTVAAAALVGIVATAVAVTGGGEGGDALNPAQRLVMDDPNSLGTCDAYIPANGSVLPDGMYMGRSYVDAEAGFVVAVMPDGTMTRVQPGPNGDYPFDFGFGSTELMPWGDQSADMGPLVIDHMSDGSAGGDVWVDANPVGWEWSVEPLSPAPAGVNGNSLYATFAMTMGFVGMGYEPSAVPEGAVTEAVAIYSDGSEVAGALVRDLPAPILNQDIDATGLEAVALRVTLADGEVWEIRANYDPSNIPVLPCQPTPPSGPLEWPSETPTDATEPGVSEGPATDESQAFGAPLTGPESEVFQCDAPLPADLQDSGDVQARVASGAVMISDPDTFDVGEDGLVVDVTSPLWEVDPETTITQTPRVTGWTPTGSGQGDGPFYGNLTYLEVVAVTDGAIVGAAGEPVEDWTASGVGGATTADKSSDTASLTGGFIGAFNGIHGLLQPCGDVSPADLENAQLAVVYGFGPDVESMTYGWTLVSDD